MDRNRQNHQQKAIRQQAASWFHKMSDKTVSDDLREKFEQWQNQNGAHRQAYSQYQVIWNNPYFERALRELAYQREKKFFIQWPMAFAMAVSLLVAVPLAFILLKPESTVQQSIIYQTKIGERQHVTLPDGSTLTLNTDTLLSTTFDSDSRQVNLERGQAYFNVAKDERPFQVHGGTGVVSVLGTAFDVQITRGSYSQMLVTVEQGRIAVSPESTPAQRREIGAQQKIAVIDYKLGYASRVSGDIADWRDGWLEFNNHALPYVIKELDRYYPGDILLGNADLKGLRVTGRFDLTDVERAVSVLAKSLGLDIAHNNGDRLILKNGKAGEE